MKNLISPLEFAELIPKLPSRFLLTSHINPDGDGLGAMAGLGRALKAFGKNVEYILRDPIKPYYEFLEELRDITLEAPRGFEDTVLMSFDSSSPDILSLPDGWQDWGCPLMVLDHHVSNQGFGDWHLVRTDCISSCLLGLEAAEAMNIPITPEMATAFYLGLIYDTGRFSYTADPEAFEAAARLLKYGADHFAVFNCLYRHNDLRQYRINADLLSRLQEHCDGSLVTLTIDEELSPGIDLEETEYLVNHIADIRDIEVVAVFKYMEEGNTKLCLRSRGRHSVADLAVQYGGGGHRCASGATLYMDLAEAQRAVMQDLVSMLS